MHEIVLFVPFRRSVPFRILYRPKNSNQLYIQFTCTVNTRIEQLRDEHERNKLNERHVCNGIMTKYNILREQ